MSILDQSNELIRPYRIPRRQATGGAAPAAGTSADDGAERHVSSTSNGRSALPPPNAQRSAFGKPPQKRALIYPQVVTSANIATRLRTSAFQSRPPARRKPHDGDGPMGQILNTMLLPSRDHAKQRPDRKRPKTHAQHQTAVPPQQQQQHAVVQQPPGDEPPAAPSEAGSTVSMPRFPTFTGETELTIERVEAHAMRLSKSDDFYIVDGRSCTSILAASEELMERILAHKMRHGRVEAARALLRVASSSAMFASTADPTADDTTNMAHTLDRYQHAAGPGPSRQHVDVTPATGGRTSAARRGPTTPPGEPPISPPVLRPTADAAAAHQPVASQPASQQLQPRPVAAAAAPAAQSTPGEGRSPAPKLESRQVDSPARTDSDATPKKRIRNAAKQKPGSRDSSHHYEAPIKRKKLSSAQNTPAEVVSAANEAQTTTAEDGERVLLRIANMAGIDVEQLKKAIAPELYRSLQAVDPSLLVATVGTILGTIATTERTKAARRARRRRAATPVETEGHATDDRGGRHSAAGGRRSATSDAKLPHQEAIVSSSTNLPHIDDAEDSVEMEIASSDGMATVGDDDAPTSVGRPGGMFPPPPMPPFGMAGMAALPPPPPIPLGMPFGLPVACIADALAAAAAQHAHMMAAVSSSSSLAKPSASLPSVVLQPPPPPPPMPAVEAPTPVPTSTPSKPADVDEPPNDESSKPKLTDTDDRPQSRGSLTRTPAPVTSMVGVTPPIISSTQPTFMQKPPIYTTRPPPDRRQVPIPIAPTPVYNRPPPPLPVVTPPRQIAAASTSAATPMPDLPSQNKVFDTLMCTLGKSPTGGQMRPATSVMQTPQPPPLSTLPRKPPSLLNQFFPGQTSCEPQTTTSMSATTTASVPHNVSVPPPSMGAGGARPAPMPMQPVRDRAPSPELLDRYGNPLPKPGARPSAVQTTPSSRSSFRPSVPMISSCSGSSPFSVPPPPAIISRPPPAVGVGPMQSGGMRPQSAPFPAAGLMQQRLQFGSAPLGPLGGAPPQFEHRPVGPGAPQLQMRFPPAPQLPQPLINSLFVPRNPFAPHTQPRFR